MLFLPHASSDICSILLGEMQLQSWTNVQACFWPKKQVSTNSMVFHHGLKNRNIPGNKHSTSRRPLGCSLNCELVALAGAWCLLQVVPICRVKAQSSDLLLVLHLFSQPFKFPKPQCKITVFFGTCFFCCMQVQTSAQFCLEKCSSKVGQMSKLV